MIRPRQIAAAALVMVSLAVLVKARAGSIDTMRNTDEETPPVRLMSTEKHARLRAYLPDVEDPAIQQILEDERLILYTRAEIPTAYQDWDGGLQGIHSTKYNISANQSEPFGNANLEFPWGTPAGTHRTKNVSTFRLLWLPAGPDGNALPVVWYRQQFPGDVMRGYAWIFPVGTVIGEVLMLRGPDGKKHTFELRVRKREYGEWHVDVFRPFPTAGDLAERIKEERPDWGEHSELAELVRHLETPMPLKKYTLIDEHPRPTFNQTMGLDSLPPVGDDGLVAQLLSQTQFRSALGTAWRRGTNDLYTCAPTTKASFHIVPANYDAGFIEVDRVSCMRCHETVGEHAQTFEFGRDWYGRVRGSDGIFSFHPFDPASISHNGFGVAVRMRAELVEADILEKYDPEKHSDDVYQLIQPQAR